jgi:hypothetical protein
MAKLPRPALPSLVIIPDNAPNDYKALYFVAKAYAESGLILNERASSTKCMEFAFPSMVCSGFAIELFLKFFLVIADADAKIYRKAGHRGHKLVDLWGKVDLCYQEIIVGMFRNDSGKPYTNALDRRIEMFVKTMRSIGNQPFVEWRYVHEMTQPAMMQHGPLAEILNALWSAAEFTMNQKAGLSHEG